MAELSTEKTKTFRCEECNLDFRAPQALGRHRQQKHGIPGSSYSAQTLHARKAAENNPNQPPKRKYTKRSDQLATIPASQNGHRAHPEHHHHEDTFNSTEAAVSFAYGRYFQLCEEVSREFGIPSQHFARQLSAFIARQR